MIRRFNYTGRTKISKNRIDISLLKDSGGKYFKAKIDLEGLGLDPLARIYIEAYYKGIYQRFAFGTVSSYKAPENTRLNELPDTELVYFDISVVDEKGKIGLLLGKAKGISICTDSATNDRIPLLPVNPTDLKNQFWKLSFDSSDDGRPLLEVNKNIPDIFEMARNDIKFISLVYPTAFRQVLIKLLNQGDFDNDEDSWVSQWVKFINVILGIKNLPEIEDFDGNLTPEQESWVDDCVNEFSKKFHLFEKFTTI